MIDNAVFIFICAAVVVIVFIVIACSKSTKKDDFDERQLLARNAAYKYAFFTLALYNVVCAILFGAEIKWADTGTQMMIGLHISAFVFAALCILRDAFFTQTSRTMKSCFLFSVFCLLLATSTNIISAISSGKEFVSDSGFNLNIMPFCSGILWFGLGIVAVVKMIINKKQAVEDE